MGKSASSHLYHSSLQQKKQQFISRRLKCQVNTIHKNIRDLNALCVCFKLDKKVKISHKYVMVSSVDVQRRSAKFAIIFSETSTNIISCFPDVKFHEEILRGYRNAFCVRKFREPTPQTMQEL